MLSIALAIKFDELKAGITTLIIKKHSVNGKQAWLEPARGKRPGGFNRLESPYGERGMVAPQGDMVVTGPIAR
jgi:hypothetical protein